MKNIANKINETFSHIIIRHVLDRINDKKERLYTDLSFIAKLKNNQNLLSHGFPQIDGLNDLHYDVEDLGDSNYSIHIYFVYFDNNVNLLKYKLITLLLPPEKNGLINNNHIELSKYLINEIYKTFRKIELLIYEDFDFDDYLRDVAIQIFKSELKKFLNN